MITFDENGQLTPPDSIVGVDLAAIELHLVNAFPNSVKRLELYQNYVDYILDLRNNISKTFVQWINGSFVSQKENPNDIDLVTFLDYNTFQQHEKVLENYRGLSLQKAKGLDAYILPIYPDGHKLYYLNELNRQEWRILFTKTRRNPRTNKAFSKGFLSLSFA